MADERDPQPPTESREEAAEKAHRAWLAEHRKVEYLCSNCGASDIRTEPQSPTSWVDVLQGVREEMRLMTTEEPRRVPHCDDTERALVAAALAGLRVPSFDHVRGAHFYRMLLGLIWDIAREVPAGKKPDLDKIAHAIEARGRGRAHAVLDLLRKLDGPYQVARCDEGTIGRMLDLAWQREMLYDAHALVHLLEHPLCRTEDVRTHVKTLRARLESGKALLE